MVSIVPVYFRAGWAYNLASLGIVAALILFYTIVHHLVSRRKTAM